MNIRRLSKEDFDASAALSQYAFQYELTKEQLDEQRGGFNPDEVWGAFEDDRLIAQAAVLDLAIYLNGAEFPMGGVAGVATWPEYRRQGAVAALIGTALKAMKDKGQTVSMLAPFSFAFYRKYGWELYVDYRKYTLEQALLPGRQDTGGRVERRDGDIELLAPIYDAYAARFNGTLVRTGAWWRDRVLKRKSGHAAVYFSQEGKPGGYILYEVKARDMTIHEFVALDEPARRGLWSFVANHDSMIDKATVILPSDDALPYMLDNPRIHQELVPYFMARIVELPGFIANYRFMAVDTEPTLSMQILDPHAPWNEGTWELAINREGSANLAACERGEAHNPDISCDIQTATAMLFGYKRPAELLAYGKLSATEHAVQLLERVLPRRTTFLIDFF